MIIPQPRQKVMFSVFWDAFLPYVALTKSINFLYISSPKVIIILFEFTLDFPWQGPIRKACINRYCSQDAF